MKNETYTSKSGYTFLRKTEDKGINSALMFFEDAISYTYYAADESSDLDGRMEDLEIALGFTANAMDMLAYELQQLQSQQ